MANEIASAITMAKSEITALAEERKLEIAKQEEEQRPEKLHLEILPYSEVSSVLVGDTKWMRKELAQLKICRYNNRLVIHGEKASGWVFSNRYLKAMEKLVSMING